MVSKKATSFSFALLTMFVSLPAPSALAQSGNRTPLAEMVATREGQNLVIDIPQSRCRQDYDGFDGPPSDWVCMLTADEVGFISHHNSEAMKRAPQNHSVDAMFNSAPIFFRMIDRRGHVAAAARGIGPMQQPDSCGLPARTSCGLAIILQEPGKLIG